MIKGNTLTREDSDFQSEQYEEPIRQLLSLPDTHICDVWASNFEEEMKKLSQMSQRFNVIAMDTQFPGMYVRKNQIASFGSEEEVEYSLIRNNVEETKLIQIGLTISDEDGNVPHPVCTWQFNFKFDISKDNIVNQSADLLKKAGVQFDKLKSEGINFLDFAEYFESSGLVYQKDVKWVVFHGSSDFAYLLKLVRNTELPSTIDEFYRELKKFFPTIYDLKYIIKEVPGLKDLGLAKLSSEIGCSRIGPQHQAGSDSLLTLCCYFKMQEQCELFHHIKFDNHANIIFGIGIGYLKNNLNGYQQRGEYENSYVHREYYEEQGYYEGQNWNNLQNYNIYSNGHNQGALYNYMQHQQHNTGFVPYDQHQRPRYQ